MINKSQTTEIRNYLASKKLQLDLFLEVEDHFVSQISQLMKDKNIGFEEAFLQTKILWTGELKMVPASIFSFQKVTVFEKKMVNKRLNSILLNSLVAGICLFAINFVLPESGVFIQLFLAISLFLIFGVSLFKKKIKFIQFLFLSFHPMVLKIVILSFILPIFATPIFTAFSIRSEVSFLFSNSILFSSIILLVQIQLLSANFNNKKVLLG